MFRNNGVKDIRDFVEQRIRDAKKQYAALEQAVELLEDIKLRESFRVYYKKFLQSMDTILPHSLAQPYKVPMKRFGYLLSQVKERYKDDSLSISGAGEKVKKLVNEHLISLGINPKIPPVELISANFMQQVNKNQNPKAKASEMEHAIRKHCKVHWQEDPALYKKLSDKLDALIQKHKEDWDKLAEVLEGLAHEAVDGRKTEGDDSIEAPFRDLIADMAFNGNPISEEDWKTLHKITHDVVRKFRDTIGIVDFWENAFEIKRLKGELSDVLLSSGCEGIINDIEHIVTEITALAKVRHQDLLG